MLKERTQLMNNQAKERSDFRSNRAKERLHFWFSHLYSLCPGPHVAPQLLASTLMSLILPSPWSPHGTQATWSIGQRKGDILGAIFEVNHAERKDTFNEQSGKGKVTF